MSETPHIIILNGVGSVGKSATARAIQAIARLPMLHVSTDAFIDMLPEHLFGHTDGLDFGRIDGQQPTMEVRVGHVVERTLNGMRHAVAAMASQGNHLIVDEVMIGQDVDIQYRNLLSSYDVHVVGLFAKLDVLEARERERGDREIGLARWQFERIYKGRTYDLEVDTGAASPEQSARLICEAFGLLPVG